jgi:hypothetical protein
LNVGISISTGDLILCVPADGIMGHNYIEKLVDAFPGDMMYAWNKQINLSCAGTLKYMSDRDYKTIWDSDHIIREIPLGAICGEGAGFIGDRDFYFNMFGGWNEHYYGWGGADCDMTVRTRALKPDWSYFDYTMLHLEHSDRLPTSTAYEIFPISEKYPKEVSKLIVGNCGKLSGPTLIDFKGILGDRIDGGC